MNGILIGNDGSIKTIVHIGKGGRWDGDAIVFKKPGWKSIAAAIEPMITGTIFYTAEIKQTNDRKRI